jgi:hypothetical protein
VVGLLFVVGRGCFGGCCIFLESRLCHLMGVVVCSGYWIVAGISKCSGSQCSGVSLSSIFLLLVILLFSIGCILVLLVVVVCYWCGFFSSVTRHNVIVV